MKTMVFALFTAFVLTSCMSPPAGSGDYMASDPQVSPEDSERIQALQDAGKSFSHTVIVPAARNPLSVGIALGALKAGGSAQADSLLDILRAGQGSVAVVGKSDMLTVATIESAVHQLSGPSSTVLLFAGSPKYIEQLQQLADKAGIPFEGVVFPVSAPETETEEDTE